MGFGLGFSWSKQMHSHVKMRKNTMGNYANGIPEYTHTYTHTRTHANSNMHGVTHTWANVTSNKYECECEYNIMLLTYSHCRKRQKGDWVEERRGHELKPTTNGNGSSATMTTTDENMRKLGKSLRTDCDSIENKSKVSINK